MNFKLYLERYSGSQPIIVYHGTSVDHLSAILSQGLIPTPKNRKWDKDDDGSFLGASKKSLDGVYITDNLMTASGAAPPRDKLLVIAQVQPRALVADEDDVALNLSNVTDNDYVLTQLYFSIQLKNNLEFVEQYKEKYKNKFFEHLNFKLQSVHPQLRQRLEPLVDQSFYITVNRQAAYVDSNYFNRQKAYYNKGEADNIIQPNKQQAELTFRNLMDQFTKTLKILGQPDKRKEGWTFNFTSRLLTPIGFSGTNKILAIVKSYYDGKTKAKVLFGEVPQKFIDDWRKSIGDWDEAISS